MPPQNNERLDLLQNIEWAILTVYVQNPELADFQVDSALEALGRTYLREASGKPTLPKNALAQQVYDAMKHACDWRLGRETVVDEEGQPMNVDPVTVDEILAALKRLRKSVSMWNNKGGTRGYLDYIRQFML